MAATIKIKNSSTANAKPTSSDLVQGELAINVTDKKIFTEDSGGNVVELGANFNGFKNRIINGAMMFDQRNAGAAWGTSINGFSVDRWACYQSVTGKINGGQNYNSVTPPAGFSKQIGVQSQSAYSVGSSDYYVFRQPIEGNNIADLAWGTASASAVTLSFWVRSSLTGTFGGSLSNGTVSYPFTYTISAANTWEQKTVTIAGPTTGTWNSDNTLGMYVYLGMGVGSTYSGTAGSWATGNYYTTTGATSVVGTNGATFYITGVQLEKGSTATSFDYRPYGTELALCQRYFTRLTGRTNAYQPLGLGNTYTTTQGSYCVNVPVTMRAIPSLTTSGAIYFQNLGNVNISSFAGPYSQAAGIVEGDFTMASTVSSGVTSFMRFNNATAATQQFDFSAEL